MNVPMRYYHPSIKDVGGVRKIVKNLSPNFDAQKMSYTQKFKIPLPKPPLGVPINVPMRYYHPSIKNVGGVRKNVKKSKSEL